MKWDRSKLVTFRNLSPSARSSAGYVAANSEGRRVGGLWSGDWLREAGWRGDGTETEQQTGWQRLGDVRASDWMRVIPFIENQVTEATCCMFSVTLPEQRKHGPEESEMTSSCLSICARMHIHIYVYICRGREGGVSSQFLPLDDIWVKHLDREVHRVDVHCMKFL